MKILVALIGITLFLGVCFALLKVFGIIVGLLIIIAIFAC